ncbi:MAG TPA: cupin domain-containing protein [Pyrinomonadaceae bacterium]|nr:cupin domain-containing protein [Pyrinomonadaceae bacterium]
MAVILEGGCRVSDMQEGEPFFEGTLRIWRRIGRANGAQAISMRVMEFAPGLSPGIRNDDCDEILYVVAARDELDRAGEEVSTTHVSGWVDLSIDGNAHKVGPDTGIFIRPGETFAVDNPGSDPLTIISCQCPDPDQNPQFVNILASSTASLHSNQLPIVRLADQKAQPAADRWYRVLVDDEVGSTQATQFVGSIPPGRAPDHFHNYEEVLFILKGEGRMWAGETNTPIAEGSCIYLPKGQVHCVENTGKGELRLLGVFYPAGSPSVRYDV